jgi:hypothetical protein
MRLVTLITTCSNETCVLVKSLWVNTCLIRFLFPNDLKQGDALLSLLFNFGIEKVI